VGPFGSTQASDSPPNKLWAFNRAVGGFVVGEQMNESHLKYLASQEWAAALETELLPWVDSVGDLGDDVLEIGPGPGLTTDLLRQRVPRLTAVEVDASLAVPLRERLIGSNVEVICADAAESGLESKRFSAVTSFAMLHHVPSYTHQSRLFGEVHRVLRPGGIFVGTDALDSEMIRAAHAGDTYVPIEPETLVERLVQAGFADTELDIRDHQFRFVSRTPG
jgi:SAM-dependent methyltransferase